MISFQTNALRLSPSNEFLYIVPKVSIRGHIHCILRRLALLFTWQPFKGWCGWSVVIVCLQLKLNIGYWYIYATITKMTHSTLARTAFSVLQLHRIAHPLVQTCCTRGPRVHVYHLCLPFICQANILFCGEPYKSARCSTFTGCSAAAVITPRRESAGTSRGSWREVQTAPSTLTPVDAILGMHACHIDLADHRLAERGNERWVW